MVGVFSFEGPSGVLQQVRVRLTHKMGMTALVLKVKFVTFMNVGQQVDFQPHTFPLGATGHHCRHVGEGH